MCQFMLSISCLLTVDVCQMRAQINVCNVKTIWASQLAAMSRICVIALISQRFRIKLNFAYWHCGLNGKETFPYQFMSEAPVHIFTDRSIPIARASTHLLHQFQSRPIPFLHSLALPIETSQGNSNLLVIKQHYFTIFNTYRMSLIIKSWYSLKIFKSINIW